MANALTHSRAVLLLALSLLSTASFLAIHSVSAGSLVLSGSFNDLLVDPSRSRLYLTEPSTSSVVVFNTTSDRIISRIFVGSGPNGLDISSNRNELYVALTNAGGLGVIDLVHLNLSRTIHLTANPADVAAGPQGLAYVTTIDTGSPRVVDTQKNSEIGNITSAFNYPDEMVRVSPDHSLLFIGVRGLSPALLQKYTATKIPVKVGGAPFDSIGSGLSDLSIAPDGLIYIASGSIYSIQIVNSTDWTSAGALDTGPYPSSVGLAENGTMAFATHSTNYVEQFATKNFTLRASFALPGEGGTVRATPDGSKVYVLISGGLFMVLTRPPPNGTFTYFPVPPVVNEPVTFQAVPISYLGSITSYLWNFGDGTHAQGQQAIHSFSVARLYNVSLTLVDSSGKSNSTSQTIYVATHPYQMGVTIGTQASYSVTVSETNGTGGVVNLRADTMVISAQGTNVTMNVDLYRAGSLVNSAPIILNVATGFESTPILPFVLVSSDLVAGDPVYATAEFQNLTIQEIPIKALNGVLRTADLIQYPGPFSFSASWDHATGVLASLTATVPVNSTLVSASYQLIGTNAWAHLTASIGSPTKSGPPPLQVGFTSLVAGGQGSYAYYWSFGDGASSTQANPNHTFSAAGNYTVTLTVVDSAGNEASASFLMIVGQKGTLQTQFLQPLLSQLRTLAIIVGIIYGLTVTLALGYFLGRRGRKRPIAPAPTPW